MKKETERLDLLISTTDMEIGKEGKNLIKDWPKSTNVSEI